MFWSWRLTYILRAMGSSPGGAIFVGLSFSRAEAQEVSNVDQDIYVLSEKVQQFGKFKGGTSDRSGCTDERDDWFCDGGFMSYLLSLQLANNIPNFVRQ